MEKTENILTLKPQIANFGRDIKFETVSFPEISKKEIYDRYNFCEKIFNSLLRDLVIELNSIHKIDYSQRSWDIIIGKWLRDIIHISYKNYLQIDYALKNYNINKPIIKEFLGAVSAGIINDQANLDLNYQEDADAQVDANFVICESGKISEIQVTGEEYFFSDNQFNKLFELSKKGVAEIIKKQKTLLSK